MTRALLVCRRLIDFFEGGGNGVEVRQCWGMSELSPLGTLGALKVREGGREGAGAAKGGGRAERRPACMCCCHLEPPPPQCTCLCHRAAPTAAVADAAAAPLPANASQCPPFFLQGTLGPAVSAEERVRLKLKQGRPHLLLDMRSVDEAGRELPWDGQAFGNLQVRGWAGARVPGFRAAVGGGANARGLRCCPLCCASSHPLHPLHPLRWRWPYPAQVRGAATVSRYYRSDAAAVDAEGWFDTGDVATLDSLGHMQVWGRGGGAVLCACSVPRAPVPHPHPTHTTPTFP